MSKAGEILENLNKFNEFYNINIPKEVIHNYIDKNKIINWSTDKYF